MKKNLIFTLKAWPAVFAIAVGISYLTQWAATLCGIELHDQKQVEIVRQMFESGNLPVIIINLALILAIMPVLEEFLFRWVTKFSLVLWPVSAVLFSAAHYLQAPFPDNAFLALVFFGLAQCWIYRKTGRLWCAMLNHALFNLTNLILLFLLPAG